LQWIDEGLLQPFKKYPNPESAIRVEASLIECYRKYQIEIPNETKEQIRNILIDLTN
jgi:hypothetical protein